MPKRGHKRRDKSDGQALLPSAQMFFRIMIANNEMPETMRKLAMKQGPNLLLRDGPRVKLIRQASTPEALIDLAAAATGLADLAWNDRMREFGPAALDAIADRLPRLATLEDRELADHLAEKLIGALRWMGSAGADVLLRHFDALDDYAKSMAATALGLLGAHESAEKLWNFYQKALRVPQETYFIGPLLGLMDLGDPQLGDELAALLDEGWDFHELYGLLARSGNAQAVVPLTVTFTRLPKARRDDALMALVAIGYRIGREALVTALEKGLAFDEADMTPAQLADAVLTRPADWPRAYFALFYGGFDQGSIEELLK